MGQYVFDTETEISWTQRSDVALEFSCNSFCISGNSNDAVFLIQGTTTLVDTLRLDFDIDAIRF